MAFISSVNYCFVSVLCTSPNKFTVIDPEGWIAQKSSMDVVVRYTQPSVTHNNTTEKFRVAVFDRDTQQVCLITPSITLESLFFIFAK